MNASDASKPDDETEPPESTDSTGPKPAGGAERTLPSLGKVNVEYRQAPPAPATEKQIHPRRPLPMTPEAPAGDK